MAIIRLPLKFPDELNVGNKNGDRAQYFTQNLLAQGCQYLAGRRRHVIPGVAGRTIFAISSPNTLTYYHCARRYIFERGLYICGFYYMYNTGSGPSEGLVNLAAQVTSPSGTALSVDLPTGGEGVAKEFRVYMGCGDGSQTSSGDIEFQTVFSFLKSPTGSLTAFRLLGLWFEPELRSEVEVTT